MSPEQNSLSEVVIELIAKVQHLTKEVDNLKAELSEAHKIIGKIYDFQSPDWFIDSHVDYLQLSQKLDYEKLGQELVKVNDFIEDLTDSLDLTKLANSLNYKFLANQILSYIITYKEEQSDGITG